MNVSHRPRVFGLEVESTLALAESIGSVRALTVYLLVKYGEWQQLVDLEILPHLYDSCDKFACDYLVTKVLSKNSRLPLDIDRAGVAIRKFYDAEALCLATNTRLKNFREDPHCEGSDYVGLVIRIQNIIQRILSAFPNRNDLDYSESQMRFGPGATTSLSGIVTQGTKYKRRTLDCTKELVGFRAFCFPHLWKENVPEVRIRDYSKLTTVPKNAKTDRVICIEPDLNIFVQLGIGALLKRKLLRFGLDLSTQERNQQMAQRAHADRLATVDLSSASDTISYEVVGLLLPPAWCDLLEYPRVPATSINGNVVPLQKWSSMGNGYTFELETLIFYATALAVTDEDEWGDVTAYGDDIILPAKNMDLLSDALTFLGFRVNSEKTFGIGRFHESCGTDFFDGQNVRPFFLRSEHHDFDSVCYLYANNARRWACRRNGGWSCDARVLPFWLRCFSAVKPNHRYQIPEGFGDVGFISDFDRAKPTRSGRGWDTWKFFYRRIVAVERYTDDMGCYLAFLSGKTTDFLRSHESIRGRYRRAVQSIGHSFQWPNLGPWL